MARNPKTPTPDPAEEALGTLTDAQRQQFARRQMVAHRRLKIAFADAYVENGELREDNARLNEVMQEQQRVMREMSAKLPKDKPEPAPKVKPKPKPKRKAPAKS